MELNLKLEFHLFNEFLPEAIAFSHPFMFPNVMEPPTLKYVLCQFIVV